MSDPYIGELRLVGFNFAPVDWAVCGGQIMSIADNDALFALIGTIYGGNGQTTFGLPNLQSRVTVHQGSLAGQTYTIGQTGGAENVTIVANTYPSHTHPLLESTNSSSLVNTPAGNAAGSGGNFYAAALPPAVQMLNTMVSTAAGGGQPHNNIQPFQALNWIIALYGTFPSQS